MLTIYGDQRGNRHGFSRRDILKIGALAVGGLSLPQLLRAEASAAAEATGKSIIHIWLQGGPSHVDTFDMKPDVPKEYRSEFRPITTNVPGIEICELMPRLARVADKFSIVRSLTGMHDEHSSWQSFSGWSEKSLQAVGGRPSVGAVMSKMIGPANTTPRGTAPTHVDMTDQSNFGICHPGFLGQIYAGYRPDEVGRSNLKLDRSISLNRLENRRALLSKLDRFNRQADHSGMMDAMDSFTQRAAGMITSGNLADALDITKEDPQLIQRYGINAGSYPNDRFLLARRLIEAGVRCVSFNWGVWDTHGKCFRRLRHQLPHFDRGMAALLEDLDARGLLENTIIMAAGEFGRTPRINYMAGRDHWMRCGLVFLAGGGLRTGQVVGSTTRLGDQPLDRPLHPQQVFATVYHLLGIDVETTLFIDPNGRPEFLLESEHREVIRELL